MDYAIIQNRIEIWLSSVESFGINRSWLILIIAVPVTRIILAISRFIIRRLKRSAQATTSELDDLFIQSFESPLPWLVIPLCGYAFVEFSEVPETFQSVLQSVFKIGFGVGFVSVCVKLTDVVVYMLEKSADSKHVKLDFQLVPFFRKTLRVVIFSTALLLVLQNLGVNVMSLVAGLGLGGLAFALAAKDTAANLIGSVMILIDQPFRIGDWITCGSLEGTVEEIGFRSTRIRTFYNSEASIPNSQIANETIDNMGRREFRRIRTTIGVMYSTPPESIETFINEIRNIILAHPQTKDDKIHVYFNNYGASSLDIMLYFFVEVPSWEAELLARQELFLKILKLAKKLGISFAFPSQSLYMESLPSKSLDDLPNLNPQKV